MRKIRGINLAIIILSGMLISVFIFGYIQVNDNKIAKNTYIKNVDIGKLSKEEAKEKIKNECKFETITFTYKDKEWNVEPRDIDTKYDIDQTIENALNVNRNKNILYNSIDMIKSNLGIENNVNIVVDCNEEKVKEKLKEMEKIHLDKLNVLQGIVKTTIPLEEYEYNSLVEKLEKKYNKDIILKKIIDPEILGGIYVRIGNDIIDGTVKTRLEDLKKLMLTTE